MATRPLCHPAIETVTLAGILHALADPVRLAIVCELREAEVAINCVETMNRCKVALPKSTCSQHFQILRRSRPDLLRTEGRRAVELLAKSRARVASFPAF